MPKILDKAVSRLICPHCRQQIALDGNTWKCTNAHTFPDIDGVPALRKDIEQVPVKPEGGDGVVGVQDILNSRGFIAAVKRLIGTNYTPYPEDFKRLVKPEDLVLNIGCGMSEQISANTLNLDYFLFPRVDLVADAGDIPFSENTFDMVVSEFMLEHVANPGVVCNEMMRVLKPGGIIYVSYPFIHPYHSFPCDFFRFTYSGVQTMFSGMKLVKQGPLTGPASRWIGSTADIISFLAPGKAAKFGVRLILLTALFPIKYLDLIFNRMPEAMDHAVTLYAI